MDGIQIRRATREDVPLLTAFMRGMVEEMATLGGYAIAQGEAAQTAMMAAIATDVVHPEHGYFLAERLGATPVPLGMVAASRVHLEGAFAPKVQLHISAVYVVPAARSEEHTSELQSP